MLDFKTLLELAGFAPEKCLFVRHTPERAIDQLALIALQAGAGLRWDDLVHYIRRSIDVVVQITRSPDGRVIEGKLWLASDQRPAPPAFLDARLHHGDALTFHLLPLPPRAMWPCSA